MDNNNLDLMSLVQNLGTKILVSAGKEPVEMFRRITDFRNTLINESDRGCALMSAAYLDECLGRLLRSYFIDDTKVINKLFDYNGACGTFSSKIELAYGLGLIPKNVRLDLTLLRRIRNDFAHVSKVICFDDDPIKSRCYELKLYPHPKIIPSRSRFCRSMVIAVTQIETTAARLDRCIVKEEYDGENSSQLAQTFAKKLDDEFGTSIAERL